MMDEVFAFDQIIFISLDQESMIINLSPAAEQYLGGAKFWLQNKSIHDVIPDEHPLIAVHRRSGAFSLFDCRFKLMSSSIELFDVHKIETDVGDSIFIYPKPTGMDKNFVNEVRGATRQTSAMAAMLSHEIRNPLAAIKGASQLLESSVAKEDAELLIVIDEEASRIGNLVNEFEEFAADSTPEIHSVNIHHILNQALRAARAGFANNINIQEIYDPSLPEIAANPDQLQRAITNILKNACEAIYSRFERPEVQGRLKISSSYRRGYHRKDQLLPVEITIGDNGGGLDDSLIQDIFKPFVTTKSNGTGLGLSIVARTIEEIGGIIEVENTNQGCEFRMLFPLWRT